MREREKEKVNDKEGTGKGSWVRERKIRAGRLWGEKEREREKEIESEKHTYRERERERITSKRCRRSLPELVLGRGPEPGRAEAASNRTRNASLLLLLSSLLFLPAFTSERHNLATGNATAS
ncbi:hypothetical protein WMY93_020221 [Mugilogobius chulae]|uniref:Uncharacterized protein n=1 Tax=Mugilogobius chulae TaxID=88201 RepID=A0AAW0NHL0_9GOBI